jgi:hypothetical protein
LNEAIAEDMYPDIDEKMKSLSMPVAKRFRGTSS